MDPVFELAKEKALLLYSDPDSIVKELDGFLADQNFYRSWNDAAFIKCLKGHNELFDGILELYNKAKYENEKIALMHYLVAIGGNKDKLTELILSVFESNPRPENLWEYGDLLYSLKNYKYMDQYYKIVRNSVLGSDRQMVILLIGKSKEAEAIPILKELVSDKTVYGHALEALSNFSGDDILEIMLKYENNNVNWIRNIAGKYLKKHKKQF